MASYHTRSNSLPSRPHPYTSEFDEHLSTIKASESTSTSSSISQRVNGLQDLYDCVDKALQLRLTQQALAQDQQSASVHELLDGSLRLLDICSTVKDSLLQTKESTHELQSFLRRRRGGDFNSNNDIKKYISSRKVVKKAIHKALKSLKVKENQRVFSTVETVRMVKEAEAVTVSVFKSLLTLISGPKAESFVSKVIHPKRIACEKEETYVNEFGNVDAAMHSILGHKKSNSDDIFHVQNQLKELEMCIQDLGEGVECLYRHLIKTRVSLLNILNN